MEPGITLQFVFPLALREMAAGGGNEVEPYHLMAAALKFVELDMEFFRKVIQPPEAVKLVVELQNNARKELENIGIEVPADSTRIRRILRGGSGNKKNLEEMNGKTFHRSRASRILCSSAEKRASKLGSRYWEVEHLFRAIFDHIHDYDLIEVLFQKEGYKKDPESEAKEDQIHGLVNLTALAKQGKLIGESAKVDPVSKTLLRILQDPKRNKKHILLVNKRRESVTTIWENLTIHSAPQDSSNNKIIFYGLDCERWTDRPQEIRNVFEVLQKRKKLYEGLSVCCSISPRCCPRENDVLEFSEILARMAENSKITIMLSIPHDVYKRQADKENWYSRKFFVVWAHELTPL